jgi:hypothetical protein
MTMAAKEAPNERREGGRFGPFFRALGRWIIGAPPPLPKMEPEPFPPPNGSRLGICCSGGGIRSAAYNLGALQALRGAGLLQRAEYLSAVSGGCYIAASHYIIATQSDQSPPERPPVYAPSSPEEGFLRNHASYLTPDFQTRMILIFNMLYGLAVNVVTLGTVLLLVAKTLGWIYHVRIPGLRGCAPGATGTCAVHSDDRALWAIGLIALASMGLIALDRFIDRFWRPWEPRTRFFRAWSIRAAISAVVLVVLVAALPELLEVIGDTRRRSGERGLWEQLLEALALDNPRQGPKQFVLFLSGAATLVIGAVRALTAPGRKILALMVVSVVGPLILLVPFVALVNGTATRGLHVDLLGWETAFVAAGVVVWMFGNNLRFSMHPFYRERLAWAFALRRVGGEAEEVPYRQPLSFSDIGRPKGLPELVVCAAANVSDVGITPPGRLAASFTFTPTRSGMPAMKMKGTKQLEDRAGVRALTLPALVAVSGAAISPSMGKLTRKPLRFLLALVNVRLGIWLPNPLHRRTWRRARARWWDGAGPGYVVFELLGLNTVRRKYIYVSDGGHFENLGLVELLRRQCTDIFCFDASGGPKDTFYTLGEAIAVARSDLNVEIDIDPGPLVGDEKTGWSKSDHVIGSIKYPGPNGRKGRLVYAKATVSGYAPWDAKAFKRKDDRFPNHSTGDQFFDEQKFEAYRTLGLHTARRAVDSYRSQDSWLGRLLG